MSGLLSSAIAGLIITIYYWKTTPVTGFFWLPCLVPAYLVESLIAAITRSSYTIDETLGNVISIGFWLASGLLIGHRFKKNAAAIGCWLLLYLGLYPIGFGVFFLKNILLR